MGTIWPKEQAILTKLGPNRRMLQDWKLAQG
jgi:hypothetical protein